MKKWSLVFPVVLLTAFGTAKAATIGLFDYALNLDGVVSTPSDPVPPAVSFSAFDLLSGLGTVTMTLVGVGPHYAALFVDHEIDQTPNVFFNENGVAVGTRPIGLTWEIDEPGFVFGDIYANVSAGTLDNTSALPPGQEDDVSMALGWNFDLDPGESATVRMWLSESKPAAGFYLVQTDPDSSASIYFATSLTITGDGTVPDGGSSLLMLSLALAGAAMFRMRRC